MLLILGHNFGILFVLLVIITSGQERITTELPVMQSKNYQLAEISANLRRLVRLDGRSQKQIADAAGVSPVYLNRWMKGQRMPTEENLQKAGKDMAWVDRVLKSQNATVKTTWLLTVDGRDHILFLPKEGTP